MEDKKYPNYPLQERNILLKFPALKIHIYSSIKTISKIIRETNGKIS